MCCLYYYLIRQKYIFHKVNVIFNERKLVLGLVHVMFVMLCQPKKVSKQYDCAKVGLNSLILLDIDNIRSNIVMHLLILSYIVQYCVISTNIVIYCHILSIIVVLGLQHVKVRVKVKVKVQTEKFRNIEVLP